MLDKSSLLSTVLKSAFAGLLISLGAFIYLAFPNILGACLFSIGLISVIVLGANLFTGKVGYVKDKWFCCDGCNLEVVILARIKNIYKKNV